MNLLVDIANEFEIPIINKNHKIWFFRTKGGRYYYDFYYNGFIALGWDLVSSEMILDVKTSKDAKKEYIEKVYPDEKRPGLILGQLDIFYNRMKNGDFVVIPSDGSKKVAIGRIGDFAQEVSHIATEEEYPQCLFLHRRTIEWLKIVDMKQDIYLFKALKAQQTISDITSESQLVLRNLFPVYIIDNNIHLMLQKATNAEMNASANINMIFYMLNIMDETANLYKKDSFRDEVKLKTAVGSPGFFELILPGAPVTLISVCLLIKAMIGKVKSVDGSESTGMLAIISKVNELINDYHTRKKTDVEVAEKEANIELINAQTEKVKAETAKIYAEINLEKMPYLLEVNNMECKQISFDESGKTSIEQKEEQEKIIVPENSNISSSIMKITENGSKLRTAAYMNGFFFGEKQVK